MRRKYIIQKCELTRCPTCMSRVDLLIDVNLSTRMPAFYICWLCDNVRQVGIGECREAVVVMRDDNG